MLRRIVRRLRALLVGDRVRREIDQELRFHLEMEAAEHVRAGAEPAEARRRAAVSFGGVERYREQGRDAQGARWLEETVADARFALRALIRRPGFSLVVVATLALGIGGNAAVFRLLNATLFAPLAYPDGERLWLLWQGTRGGRQWVSAPDYLDWRERPRALEEVAAFTPDRFNVAGAETAESVTGAAVTSSFFDVMGVAPALGRGWSASEEAAGEAAVVLSDALWGRRYGSDPSVLGRTVRLDGGPATVVGVMPPGFELPRGAELWAPVRLYSEDWHRRRGIDWLQVVARSAEGVSAVELSMDLDRVAAELAVEHPETNAADRIEAASLREELYGDVRTPLLVLMGAVAFVLLMACTNVAGLLLARASGRSRELAIRLALGSGRGRLVRGALWESLWLALAGALLGLLLGHHGARLLVLLAPESSGLPAGTRVDPVVLAFTGLLTVVAAVLGGLVPAAAAVRVRPGPALATGSGGAGEARGAQRVRRGLVVLQVAVAVMLVTGAALLVRSLENLLSEDIGFEPRGVLTARVALTPSDYSEPARMVAFYDELLGELRRFPNVRSAAAITDLPLGGSGITFSYEVEGAAPVPSGEEPLASFRTATAGYFETMGVPVLRGRGFEERDGRGGEFVAVIDESVAEGDFAGRDPLGRRVRVGGEWRTVVGVVGRVRHGSLGSEPGPAIYIPYGDRPRGGATVVVRTDDDPLALAGSVTGLVRQLDDAQPVFNVRPLTDYVRASSAQTRFLASMLAGFAAGALLLAALGVYGVIALAVSRRTREIGIRVAIGAQPSRVVASIIGDGMRMLAAGAALGTLGAIALGRLIAGVLYEVDARDPVTLARVLLVVTLVALAASWLPARRAARVDPARTLRAD